MHFKHWIGIVVLIFVCLAIYNAGVLGGLPVVGKYVSS
jgi:hypothetical protein